MLVGKKDKGIELLISRNGLNGHLKHDFDNIGACINGNNKATPHFASAQCTHDKKDKDIEDNTYKKCKKHEGDDGDDDDDQGEDNDDQ